MSASGASGDRNPAGELPVEILPDPAAVAHRAAELVHQHAVLAVAERGEFTFAVSGGRSPWTMFGDLAREDFPWAQTTIYQVDERIAPAGDPARNLTLLQESLGAVASAELRPMPVNDSDLEAAAEAYARSLPVRFDLIHLGIGPDGHTASLVPGDPVLEIRDRDVALSGPYMGLERMTLTYPVLERARSLLWLVTGAEKVDALRRLRAHDPSIPGGRVPTEHALVLADIAAAGV
ncbi:MAG: 6-phosphogluconolactonase [Solirubrobacteraceae bacterium]